MIVPDGSRTTRQFSVHNIWIKALIICSFGLFGLLGYVCLDYVQLLKLKKSYRQVSLENEGLKGEARILIQNLDDVKSSLRRVDDYTSKLTEITAIQTKKVAKKAGIGPLTPEEKLRADLDDDTSDTRSARYFPVGLNIEKLTFQPVFQRLASLDNEANTKAVELQKLLSTLSKQSNLLSSIPALTPVSGWITSGYGPRISPFTGKKTPHKGVDIAAPVGTPVHAPADGVVIFTGAKAGFGNFIMIAHGYGVVTRYGHNHQNMVQPGQRVKRGDQIATVGMTGRTTGPHLHYEIWVDGRTKNPKKFILNTNEFLAH